MWRQARSREEALQQQQEQYQRQVAELQGALREVRPGLAQAFRMMRWALVAAGLGESIALKDLDLNTSRLAPACPLECTRICTHIAHTTTCR